MPAVRDRLRIAIQKSGRLGDPARALLAACGLSWRESRDKLFCYGESLPVDLLLVRDDDIPGLIADGVCDFGIVGRNVLRRSRPPRAPAAACRDAYRGSPRAGLRRLPADAWRCPTTGNGSGVAQLQGKRIATSYPGVAAPTGCEKQGVEASVVSLSGSVEIAPRLGPGRPDLRPGVQRRHAAGQPAQAGGHAAAKAKRCWPGRRSRSWTRAPTLPQCCCAALDGVLKLKDSKLLLFQAQRDAMPGLLRLLPDAEPPTVTAGRRRRHAVRCRRCATAR